MLFAEDHQVNQQLAIQSSLSSIGPAMGGNGSLIGASAKMITAGIAEQTGYRISYGYFLRKGFPALLITVSLSFLWLFIRF